jgi:Ca2+:H+ antiporter
MMPAAHTLLFVLAVLAIVPLAALLSHATEAVSEKTGDAIGGLLNATLGNLTELIIAVTALRAGEYMLVKASIAGAIVTNTLFMLGASFLLGGLRYHVQEYNRAGGRMYSALLLMATIALLAPAAVSELDLARGEVMAQNFSAALAILLIVAYGLSLLFSLKTHKELFASEDHGETEEAKWPINLAVGTLLVVTVLVALVSEIFVESVQQAAATLGMSPAFVGFIIVALVGAAAEMAVAFSAARKNRLDMSVSIALGSASQIALFVAGRGRGNWDCCTFRLSKRTGRRDHARGCRWPLRHIRCRRGPPRDSRVRQTTWPRRGTPRVERSCGRSGSLKRHGS